MALLPEEVSKAWENRKGPIILTTVSKAGTPNSIYVTCVSKYSEDTLVIANNYFSKTLKNIEAGSSGSILFITPENISYQVKGRIEYHTDGPLFEDMKRWNPEKHPGHAATALKVQAVYKGAEQLL